MPDNTPQPAKADSIPDGHVMARVLPLGAGKIFTGETRIYGMTPEEKFPTHAKGDTLVLPRGVAEIQEAKGLLEIQ